MLGGRRSELRRIECAGGDALERDGVEEHPDAHAEPREGGNTVKKETRKGSIPRKTQTVDYDGLKNIRMSTRTLHKYLETSVYPPSFAQFLSFPSFFGRLLKRKGCQPFLLGGRGERETPRVFF